LLTQAAQINFDWSNEKRDRMWSARWRGFIKSPVTGNVEFVANYNHGIRFIIGGEVVFDGWY